MRDGRVKARTKFCLSTDQRAGIRLECLSAVYCSMDHREQQTEHGYEILIFFHPLVQRGVSLVLLFMAKFLMKTGKAVPKSVMEFTPGCTSPA